jgi:hypothetical protein
MKADISRPLVVGVSIAIVRELHSDGDYEWKVFVMNSNDFGIRNVLVTSKGYGEIGGEPKKTAILRHHVRALPPHSAMPIELIQPELFDLCNEFWVSYYMDDESNPKIYDKKFLFLPGSVVEENLSFIPVIQAEGVLHG